MRPLILLDVDGVLNPEVGRNADGALLSVTADRSVLVVQLVELGEVVWTSTWPAHVLHRLAADVALTLHHPRP